MTLERIGPYRIVRLLGKGGMGAVYEGFHEAIERRVAIKVLHSELGMRADMAARFFNERSAKNHRRKKQGRRIRECAGKTAKAQHYLP